MLFKTVQKIHLIKVYTFKTSNQFSNYTAYTVVWVNICISSLLFNKKISLPFKCHPHTHSFGVTPWPHTPPENRAHVKSTVTYAHATPPTSTVPCMSAPHSYYKDLASEQASKTPFVTSPEFNMRILIG